ncbi:MULTISPECIES: GNAT family N-acetyltransferase [Arthrobacter]|uniref:GNAT family N-acetyltransferase n=1 Tax=Arthrobacter caoxuetaonis TaxID=2886935 RepID=A0A9X1SD63_9MICC|nr:MULTISPECIES: GNAT family N-acetyltransferase [Arthrobacter]MCC3281230.1 GNAT family N-acetyltransferase [Arthrobacter caoxuetaonis]MCC3296519.1 GNAT family N-acetyltransferase [Arthrobacter caoxuetaonis]MCC9192595.1 GNAT family N-acetyltransferase [Arthrobacter sp. zg-Y916]USQ56648.1 GNAT family N-acetyltransferase [Arthrobacter caoxuetaonis]
MDLDPGTVAIIQLAWSRRLGLDDDALAAADRHERIYDVHDEAQEVSFVKLFGREVFSGPGWAAKQVRSISGAELSSDAALLRLSHHHGGCAMATEYLYYADSFPPVPPAEELAVAQEPHIAEALERLCPPDDVIEAKLSHRDSLFVLVDDSDGNSPVPVAGAGYSIRDGILADVAALTAPGLRMRGLGSYVTSIAVEDAMAAGLIPQSRIPSNNVGATRTAAGAGFVPAGMRSSVSLTA